MIRLNQQELQAMYPEMTAAFSARMSCMIHALPRQQEEAMKRKVYRIILIAALILGLLSTTALALTRPGVVQWLLGNRPASPQLEQTAQSILAEASADDITARITSLVFDGEQFAFSYELENHNPTLPALVALDDVLLLNGTESRLAYSSAAPYSPQMVPSPHLDILPVQRNPVVGGGWSTRITQTLRGAVDCEMTFLIYRPEKGFAVLLEPEDALAHPEQHDSQTQAEIEDSLNTLRSFQNTVIAQASPESEKEYLAQGYTIIGSGVFLQGSPHDAQNHLREAARITVRFTFDASQAITHDFSGHGLSLPDCQVQVERFRCTPLETSFDIRLIPIENTKEAAQALAEKYGEWLLTDEDDKPVVYSEMDTLYTLTPYVSGSDGQWKCLYIENLPGLLTFPESISFVTQAGEMFRFPLQNAE